MTRKEIDDIFQEYGQYATGKDYALVHAIAKAVAPQRTWVGLTDEDRAEIAAQGHQRWKEYAQAIEAKLKEKNA